MELATVFKDIIVPAMAELPVSMTGDKASTMLLTIGLKESLFVYRYQVIGGGKKGPARSFWQAEEGGGMVTGVMGHKATEALARKLCEKHMVSFTTRAVWLAIETDDVLACALARLLLWTDPYPLPATNDTEEAFKTYLRVWRPGAYTRGTDAQRADIRAKWGKDHAAARAVLGLA